MVDKDLYSTVLVLMIVLGVTHTSPTENHRAKREERCLVQGRLYRDKEIFSIPGQSRCLRYKCNDGDYSLVQEGCEFNGTCKPVGAVYTHDCSTISCTKTTRNNHFQYLSARIDPLCRDYQGACHEEDEIYPDVKGGVLYPMCYCSISGSEGRSVCY